jgi:hypothetical protein
MFAISLVVALAWASPCDFASSHGFLVLPLSDNATDCQSTNAFLLSHGATFSCPHGYNVKLTATIADDGARSAVCSALYSRSGRGWVVVGPSLPENGLPDIGNGVIDRFVSDILLVSAFGNASSGPGDGWQSQTIATNVKFFTKPLFMHQFSRDSPSLSMLTYNAFRVGEQVWLTHYITVAPNFEHILRVDSVELGSYLKTGAWPLTVSFDNGDVVTSRLQQNETRIGLVQLYSSRGHVYQATASVDVSIDYYSGVDDGFVVLDEQCSLPPPYPQSPQMC